MPGRHGPVARRLHPDLAHDMPDEVLRRLVPHASAWERAEIRREFARWLDSPEGRHPVADWAEAWNTWTWASRRRPGVVNITPRTCPDCFGGTVPSPGGDRTCTACGGSGRGRRIRHAARHARAGD